MTTIRAPLTQVADNKEGEGIAVSVSSPHIPFCPTQLLEKGRQITNKDNVLLNFLPQYVIFSTAMDRPIVSSVETYR